MHFYKPVIIDEFVISQEEPFLVIPAQAGIQATSNLLKKLDSRFHGNDDFLRVRHYLFFATSPQKYIYPPTQKEGRVGGPALQEIKIPLTPFYSKENHKKFKLSKKKIKGILARFKLSGSITMSTI
jgi:hypothetical protein